MQSGEQHNELCLGAGDHEGCWPDTLLSGRATGPWLPGNRAVAGPATAPGLQAPGLRVRIAQGPLPRRASPRRGQNGGWQQPRIHMLLDTQNRARDADL